MKNNAKHDSVFAPLPDVYNTHSGDPRAIGGGLKAKDTEPASFVKQDPVVAAQIAYDDDMYDRSLNDNDQMYLQTEAQLKLEAIIHSINGPADLDTSLLHLDSFFPKGETVSLKVEPSYDKFYFPYFTATSADSYNTLYGGMPGFPPTGWTSDPEPPSL